MLPRTLSLLVAFTLVLTARAQYPGMKQHHYKHHHSHNGLHLPDYEVEEGDWIMYGGASNSDFGFQPSRNYRTSYGVSAEYFFLGNFSIRGGGYFSQNYCNLAPAPLGVAYFKYLLEYDNSMTGKAFFGALVSLAMNDGIGYNFHIGKSLYLMPYIGTWQVELHGDLLSSDTTKTVLENDLCSLGMNLKYFMGPRFLLSADAEYNRVEGLRDGRWGYHVNFHLGWTIH